MKQRRSTEDYLKAIHTLAQSQEVHACQIAQKLGLSRPTVSVALKRLETEGYLRIDHSNVVKLTQKGHTTAKDMFERHKTLQEFFISLGVEEEIASRDACEMEHGLGQETYAALRRFVEASPNGEDSHHVD